MVPSEVQGHYLGSRAKYRATDGPSNRATGGTPSDNYSHSVQQL